MAPIDCPVGHAGVVVSRLAEVADAVGVSYGVASYSSSSKAAVDAPTLAAAETFTSGSALSATNTVLGKPAFADR